MRSYLESPLYQQMMAQTLAQQNSRPQYPGEAIANGLAKALEIYSARKAGEQDVSRQQAGNADLAKALLPEQFSGAGYKSGGPDIQLPGTDGLSIPDQMPQIADQNSDKRQQLAALLNSGGLDSQAVAPLVLKNLGLGSAQGPIKLGKDEGLYDPTTYQPIIAPKEAPQPGFTLSQGQQRFDATGKPVAAVASEVDYNKPFLPDGSPNPAYQKYEMGKTAAGRPVTSVNVSADKSFATQLGSKAADTVDALGTAARGAAQAIPVINQIYGALDSGNVTAGPGASAVQFFNQVSGGDPQKVIATRQTIQGLAQLALSARGQLKGQGQISDYEGKLLQKASAGDIDSMTVPEIRAITQVAERGARATIKAGQDAVARAKAVPGGETMAGFYDVQEPPPYSAHGAQGAPGGMPTVRTPEEAARLPRGTRFRAPDGQIRVVP